VPSAERPDETDDRFVAEIQRGADFAPEVGVGRRIVLAIDARRRRVRDRKSR
jgi:hypothetical protein